MRVPRSDHERHSAEARENTAPEGAKEPSPGAEALGKGMPSKQSAVGAAHARGVNPKSPHPNEFKV